MLTGCLMYSEGLQMAARLTTVSHCAMSAFNLAGSLVMSIWWNSKRSAHFFSLRRQRAGRVGERRPAAQQQTQPTGGGRGSNERGARSEQRLDLRRRHHVAAQNDPVALLRPCTVGCGAMEGM